MTTFPNLHALIALSWASAGVSHDLAELETIEVLPNHGQSSFEFAVGFRTSSEGEADYYCIRANLDDSRRLNSVEVTEYLPCISTHLGQVLADSRSAMDWLKPSVCA